MRAFLARKTGAGTKLDPLRPDVNFATYGSPGWASWDLQHPDTDAVVGYIVVWTGASAPLEAVCDLGDPTDKVSMRSVQVGSVAARQVLDLLYGLGNYSQGTVNNVANRTGAQVIKFLNRSEPVMAASWGATIAELIDETDV
jgi:hypothetical protein